MKFKAGDIFRVIENGFEGEVVGISFNSILQEEEYIVQWPQEALGEHCTYPVVECDSAWEFVRRSNTFRVAQSIDFLPIKIDMSGPLKVECNGHHTPIDIGFHFSKIVCKHCDKDLNG